MIPKIVLERATLRGALSYVVMGGLAAGLVGCAQPIVRSVPANSSDGSGISYYLPKRMMKVTYTRERAPTEDELKDAKDALDTANVALAKAKGDLAKAEELLKHIKAEQREARAEAQKERDIAKARLEIVTGTFSDATVTYETTKAAFDTKTMRERLSLTVLDPVADVSHRYWAQPKHIGTRSDRFNVKVNSAGLLTGTAATAEDKTAEIISQLAATAKLLASGIGPSGRFQHKQAVVREQKPSCAANDKPVSIDFYIDPIKLLEDSSGRDERSGLEQELCDVGAYFLVRRSGPADAVPGTQTSSRPCGDPAVSMRECGGGFFYRRELPYVFTVRRIVNEQGKPTYPIAGQFTASLPNITPTEFVSLEAGPLVTTAYTINFENGMLVEYASDRPSEGLAFAKLPVQVLSAIISIPADLLTLRVNSVKTETDLATSQKQLLDALGALEQARAAQGSLGQGNMTQGQGSSGLP